MRRAFPGFVAILVVAGLAGCGADREPSDLTRADVVKQLTVDPPPPGVKRLTKAECREDGDDEYVCDATTEDDDDLKLRVEADGDKILITGAETQ